MVQNSTTLDKIWFLKAVCVRLEDLKMIMFLLSQILLMEYRKNILHGMLRWLFSLEFEFIYSHYFKFFAKKLCKTNTTLNKFELQGSLEHFGP